jgi:hypothetical protein
MTTFNRNDVENLPPATDQVHRTTTHIVIKKDWRFLVLLIVLIVAPPPAATLLADRGLQLSELELLAVGGFRSPLAGIVLGWVVGGVAVWVGYLALAKETTIDRA